MITHSLQDERLDRQPSQEDAMLHSGSGADPMRGPAPGEGWLILTAFVLGPAFRRAASLVGENPQDRS